MGAVRLSGAPSMNPGLHLMAVLLVGSGGAHTPVAPVFPPRPRLLFTPATLTEFRNDPARESERVALKQRAETILARGLVVPRGEGDWIFYYACPADGSTLHAESESVHVCPRCGRRYTDERTIAAWRTRGYEALEAELDVLAKAWALTGDRRFFDPVREALVQLAKDWPGYTRHDRWGRRGLLAVVGGRRYCQLLDEAVSLIRLAGIYDLVAEGPWPADERDLVEQQQLRMPADEIGRFELFINARNNHQTWFNAAYAAVGLALGDSNRLQRAVFGSRGLLRQLETSVTEDGLWYEGTIAYHFYALQAIQKTLEAAHRVGWTFADHPRLKRLWMGPLQLAYPDGRLPVFHDSDPVSLSTYRAHYQWAADYFGDPALKAAVPEGLVSTNLSGMGIAVLRRKGIGGQPLCVMMDYGLHGDHHGHPDKLNIVLYALGEELVLDPGRISYSVPEYKTWARTTVAHNTVVVNQRDQQPDTGRLLFFEERPQGVAVLAESQGAYPGVRLRRFLVLTDLFLADAFSVEGSVAITSDWILHGRGHVTPPESLKPRLKPLGEANGYPHLTRLMAGLCTNATPLFSFTLSPSKTWTLWLPGDEEGTWLCTGLGIGYRLDDAVPFVLRRRETAHTLFLAVLDLSGQRAIESVTCKTVRDREGRPVSPLWAVGLEIVGNWGRWRLGLDLSDAPSPLSLEGGPLFERWGLEVLPPSGKAP